MAASGERGFVRRARAFVPALAIGLCLLAAALASLTAAVAGWGPLSGAASCPGANGTGFWDGLAVHLATLLRTAARWCVGLSALMNFLVAASLIGQPAIATPRAAAEVSLFGLAPLAAGWLGALVLTIGGC